MSPSWRLCFKELLAANRLWYRLCVITPCPSPLVLFPVQDRCAHSSAARHLTMVSLPLATARSFFISGACCHAWRYTSILDNLCPLLDCTTTVWIILHYWSPCWYVGPELGRPCLSAPQPRHNRPRLQWLVDGQRLRVSWLPAWRPCRWSRQSLADRCARSFAWNEARTWRP